MKSQWVSRQGWLPGYHPNSESKPAE
jgi:hypothetical protein